MKYNISPYYPELSLKSDRYSQTYLKKYLDVRFGSWCYTRRAREAIKIALSYYNLSKDDVVTILTTSGNFYISSCVTNAIESICKWSREIVPETKLLFVNHEFGYPYKNISELKTLGFPIIEDCAYAFFSGLDNDAIGKVGDFAIYSLPKAFPIECGGILACNNKTFTLLDSLPEEEIYKLNKNLAAVIREEDLVKKQRLFNYNFLLNELRSIGIDAFFELEDGIIPGVFIFKWSKDIDYPLLKVFMQNKGVECSVFYGKNAFFIPIHQNLTPDDLKYFCELLKRFVSKNEILKH